MGRRRLLLAGVVLAIAAAVWLGRAALLEAYIVHVALPGQKSPVAPHREVEWARGPETPARGPRPPNVILIVADDMGINDVSTLGGGAAGGRVPTPHIDRLAREGAIFSAAYAGHATCAPARAMIMTGRYATRTGFEFTPTPPNMGRVVSLFANRADPLHPVIYDAATAARMPEYADQGLPGEEATVAEVLGRHGYHTVHIGKWHLGRSGEFSPNAQGFDESLLMASGLYLPEDHPEVVNAKLDFDPIDRFLWLRMQYAASYNGGEWFEPKGYLTDYYTEQAIRVIHANRHRPFLLYLAHWGPHTPLQAAKADYEALAPEIGDHRLSVYAAMLRAVDRSVGRIVGALGETGLAENTLIVFTSDNGGAGYIGLPDVNKPYRGWKMTFFEGGLRVPFFVTWPAAIPAGTRIEAPVSHIDILPTVAAAAGAPLPSRPLDGRNLLPYASAAPPEEPPHSTIFWQSGYYKTVRAGDWKLSISERPAKAWLYDLANDPTERTNLAEARPDKLAELRSLLEAHHDGSVPPLYPYTIEAPILVDKTLAERPEPGDEYVYWCN